MKILQINTYDNQGGAAIAALRLHHSLCSKGIEGKFLTLIKTKDDDTVVSINPIVNNRTISAISAIDKIPLINSKTTQPFPISPAWLSAGGWGVGQAIKKYDPDIIHLHWITSGMLSISDIAKISALKPIVWTLHDMWAFTGGCHYSSGCRQYKNGCGACPLLKSESKKDLSSWIFNRKQKSWNTKNITLASPSNWLNNFASTSPLFIQSTKIVISNGVKIDDPLFKKKEICFRLNLPLDKKLILIVAQSLSDPRKGAELFFKSLERIQIPHKFDIISIGNLPKQLPKTSSKIHNFGYLSSPKDMASLYAAADVFVLPSVEDNFPNTVLESMSVGTPVVAFRGGGGAAEIIDHQINGYLVDSFDPQKLAQGISWILNNNSYDAVRQSAYNKIKDHYTMEHMAENYINLYHNILGEKTGRC